MPSLPAPPVPLSQVGRAAYDIGLASLGAELALVGVNAALAQQGFRRPPRRRLLGRNR